MIQNAERLISAATTAFAGLAMAFGTLLSKAEGFGTLKAIADAVLKAFCSGDCIQRFSNCFRTSSVTPKNITEAVSAFYSDCRLRIQSRPIWAHFLPYMSMFFALFRPISDPLGLVVTLKLEFEKLIYTHLCTMPISSYPTISSALLWEILRHGNACLCIMAKKYVGSISISLKDFPNDLAYPKSLGKFSVRWLYSYFSLGYFKVLTQWHICHVLHIVLDWYTCVYGIFYNVLSQ